MTTSAAVKLVASPVVREYPVSVTEVADIADVLTVSVALLVISVAWHAQPLLAVGIVSTPVEPGVEPTVTRNAAVPFGARIAGDVPNPLAIVGAAA